MELYDFGMLEQLMDRRPPAKVVLAAAQDPHALQAVLAAAGEGLAGFVLVGDAARIAAEAEKLGYALPPGSVVPANTPQETAALAVEQVLCGNGTLLMKGGLETPVLLRAVLAKKKEGGLRGGILSHVGLMQMPAYHKLLAVTDGAVVPYPTLAQKANILHNALVLLRALGYGEPKAALLAASETPTPHMPETGHALLLRKAAEQGLFGPCLADGPMAIDLILSKESADIKGYSSLLVQDADLILTPNIACGNALSKSFVYAGGAQMAGCVVGPGVPPVVLTSRGASAEEKRLSILLAAAVAPAFVQMQALDASGLPQED